MISDRDYMRPAPRVFANWRRWTAVNIILAANFAVFVLSFVLGGWIKGFSLESYFALSIPALEGGKIWTLLTYSFLHEGFLHIFINMLVLFFMGPAVEGMLGKAKFFLLYFLSVFGGALLWTAVNYMDADRAFMVGASAGVLGITAYFCASWEDRPVTFLFFFVIPLTMRPKMILLIIGLMELFGMVFMELAPNNSDPIAYSAHLGGMVSALAFAYFRNGRLFGRPSASSSGRAGRFWGASKEPKRNMSASDMSFNVRISSDADLRAEVNRILDKISAEGFASLTDDEKDTLKRAKDRL